MPLHETLLRREYVHNVNGLFPKPFFPSNGESEASAEGQANLTKYFTFIGRLLAKAMQDSRLLDLPFAPSFYKLLLQQPLTPADMAIIDPALHQSLTAMEALCNSRTRMKDDAPLTLDGCPIESLCLDFTLPGYPDVELVAGGKDQTVTIDNLQQYCELVREMYLATGLEVQRTALHAGFSQVLEIENLSVFSVAELEMLIRGSMEPWTASMLRDAIKCDHGFTAESRAIGFLIEILSELSADEQRLFLRFVTGSPALAVGGLMGLNPRLTVVRKNPENNCSAGDSLPSVMTCANYLKLPDYPTKEMMRAKLLVAIHEGQLSFHLS